MKGKKTIKKTEEDLKKLFSSKYQNIILSKSFRKKVIDYIKKDKEVGGEDIKKPHWFFILLNRPIIPFAIAASFVLGVFFNPSIISLYDDVLKKSDSPEPAIKKEIITRGSNNLKIDYTALEDGDQFTVDNEEWIIIKKYDDTEKLETCILAQPLNSSVFRNDSIYKFCSSGTFKVFDYKLPENDLEPLIKEKGGTIQVEDYWVNP